MSVPTLRIARKDGDEEKKSRCFSAKLLGYLTADPLWEGSGCGSPMRPVWLAYFGTEAEVRAVTANLRGGRRAEADRLSFEFPKKAGHRWESRPLAGGVVMTAYLPSVLDLQPSSPFVGDLRFVFTPPAWWLDREATALAPDFGEEARDVARAALFVAYLERRTKLPIFPDLRFQLALYRAALAEPWVHATDDSNYSGAPFRFQGFTPGGIEPPLGIKVSAPDFTAFLTQQNRSYFDQEMRHGPSRRPASGRLLPGTAAPVAQLCLDLALAATE